MLLNRLRCIRSGFTVRIFRHFYKIITDCTDERICYFINAAANLHGNQLMLEDGLVQITGETEQFVLHNARPFSVCCGYFSCERLLLLLELQLCNET